MIYIYKLYYLLSQYKIMKIDSKNIQKYKYCNILLSGKISLSKVIISSIYLKIIQFDSFEIFFVMFILKWS